MLPRGLPIPTVASENRPRILVSFPFAEKGGWFIPLGEGCAGALEDLGYEVIRFNPVVESPPDFAGRKLIERVVVILGQLFLQAKSQTKRMLPWNEEAIRFRNLIDAARRTRPDIVLVISTYTYPGHILKRLKRECGAVKTLGWCVEGPTWMRSPVDEARLYDRYFCIYPLRRSSGSAQIEYLSALVCDAAQHHPLCPRLPKDTDVVFVGRPKPRRAKILQAITEFNPRIYGPGWSHNWPTLAPFVAGDQIFGPDLNRLYNRTKIVLNISAWENGETDCPNLRIADVPASGSFLLSDYSATAAELFESGREIEFYGSVDELREKVTYYLTHDAARERIARAGYEKALKLGTYRDKMRFLLEASDCIVPGGRATFSPD